MSVTMSAFLIDWAAVREHWRINPGDFWREDGWDGEADGDWPPRFWRESCRPDDWIDSSKCAFQADEYYTKLRRDLSKADRERWDHLFAVFFAMSRAPKSFDLPGFEPNEGIYNIISPASVARLVGEIGRADVEQLRGPFEARCRPEPDRWLENFDEFAAYLRQWFAAVEAAHRSGKALVLWAA